MEAIIPSHQIVVLDKRPRDILFHPDGTRVTTPHGEKFGESVRPTRRTHALNARRYARPLLSRTAPPIWRDHYAKLGEPLREILGPASFGTLNHSLKVV